MTEEERESLRRYVVTSLPIFDGWHVAYAIWTILRSSAPPLIHPPSLVEWIDCFRDVVPAGPIPLSMRGQYGDYELPVARLGVPPVFHFLFGSNVADAIQRLLMFVPEDASERVQYRTDALEIVDFAANPGTVNALDLPPEEANAIFGECLIDVLRKPKPEGYVAPTFEWSTEDSVGE